MGVTPVHTTLIPHTPVLQENINPALQRPGSVVEKNANAHLNGIGMGMGMGAFDAFADTNPFTLKTLDAYRMQLWGKMAAQHGHGQFAPSSGMGMGMGNSPHGLASNLKPAYFASSSSSKSLAGKTAYPTPPASPILGAGFKSAAATPTREQAALAAIASQTLLGKLGSAFWEAFSGSGPSNGLGPGVARKDWDAEKVRKVLEGRAVVRVVDVELQTGVSSSATSSVEKVVERKPSLNAEKKTPCKPNVCDILEESMRSLTISKK